MFLVWYIQYYRVAEIKNILYSCESWNSLLIYLYLGYFELIIIIRNIFLYESEKDKYNLIGNISSKQFYMI